MSFLYKGETSVQKSHLDSFLALARDLGVRGFSEVGDQPQAGDLIGKEVEAEDNLEEDKLGDDSLVEENIFKYEMEKGHLELANKEKLFNGELDVDANTTEDADRFGIRLKNGRPPPNQETSHIWKFIEKVDMNFMCNMCGKTFPYYHGVEEHLLKMHSDNIDVVKFIGDGYKESDIQAENKSEEVQNEAESENGVWKYIAKLDERECMCTLCDKMFLTQEFLVLQAHLLEVHSDNLNVTFDMNPRRRKSLIWKYARRVNEFQMMCDICGKVCSSKLGGTKGTKDHILT